MSEVPSHEETPEEQLDRILAQSDAENAPIIAQRRAQRAAKVARIKASLPPNMKEPFDVHKYISSRFKYPDSIPVTPEETADLEAQYYIDYPRITSIGEFIGQLEMENDMGH